MWLRITLVLVVLGAGWYWWDHRSIHRQPGVLAPDDPVQVDSRKKAPFQLGDFVFTPVAEFRVQARVLGKERYWFGRESDLAPYDLALGWGRMSDTSVLDEMTISQSGRFYWWSSNRLPIPKDEIIRSSSNMHLIPATEDVRDRISDTHAGEVVRFEGYLVNVYTADGWHWTSSQSRQDTGDGACEVVWVERFERADPDQAASAP